MSNSTINTITIMSKESFNLGQGLTLNWDPCAYETEEAAADALYAELCSLSAQIGQDPSLEVRCLTPAKALNAGFGDQWMVQWESGPYEWGIRLSGSCPSAKWGYLEPYYSFDVCFAS